MSLAFFLFCRKCDERGTSVLYCILSPARQVCIPKCTFKPPAFHARRQALRLPAYRNDRFTLAARRKRSSPKFPYASPFTQPRLYAPCWLLFRYSLQASIVPCILS